jgi:glycosyltransferase involved in cell wall biosynthesis
VSSATDDEGAVPAGDTRSTARPPLVSIVVNNFNYGRFLRACLDSALAQTWTHTEIVVVDDGSTDDSRAILAEQPSHVRVVLRRNGGQAAALNTGFAASTGDLVLFLDSDDVLGPDAVARAVACYEPGVAKVQFRLGYVDADGRPLPHTNPPADRPLDDRGATELLVAVGRYVAPPMSGNLFSRAFLEPVMPIPEQSFRIAADGYLTTAAPFHGRVVSIDEVLGSYRLHGANAWAPAKIDAARLRMYLDHDRNRYDIIRSRVGPRADGVDLRDFRHLRARLGSLRLAPDEHPYPGDSRRALVWRGLVASWRSPEHNHVQSLSYMAWFVWVAAAPRRRVASALTMVYAPASRRGIVAVASRRLRNPRPATESARRRPHDPGA